MSKTIEIGGCTVVLDKVLYVKEYEGTSTFAGMIIFENGKELSIERHADVKKLKEALSQ